MILALGAYNLHQATSSRLAAYEREAFASIAILALLAVIASMASGKGGAQKFVIANLAPIIFVPTVFFQQIVYPGWVVADLAFFLVPVWFYWFAKYFPSMYSRENLLILAGFMLVAAAMSPLYADSTVWNRFEPPDFLLMSISWWCLYKARSISSFSIWGGVVIMMLILAWESTVRVNVVVWVVAGAFAGMMVSRQKLVSIFSLSLVVLLLVMTLGSYVAEQLQQTRFAEVDFNNVTEAHFVLGRLAEAHDVFQYMFSSPSAIISTLVGEGLGATFIANDLIAVSPFILDQDFRVTADGRTHLIHVVPIMMFFRYGVLGLFLYVYIVILVVADSIRALRNKTQLAQQWTMPVLLLCMQAYVANSLLRPVAVNLDFAVILAGYLLYRTKYRLPQSTDGHHNVNRG